MPESDNNSSIKGSEHTSVSRTPREFRGAHESKPKTIAPLTDQQIEDDFLAAFTPFEPIREPTNPQPLDEPEVHIGKKEPDSSPSSIILPKGTVVYDEKGETYILEEPTEVDGRWIRPPKSEGGPARFVLSSKYPKGRDAGGTKAEGQYALRKGKLWYGQKNSEIKPSNK